MTKDLKWSETNILLILGDNNMQLKMKSAIGLFENYKEARFGQDVVRPPAGEFGAGVPQAVTQAPAGQMPPLPTTPEEEQVANETKAAVQRIGPHSSLQELVNASKKLERWIAIQQQQENQAMNSSSPGSKGNPGVSEPGMFGGQPQPSPQSAPATNPPTTTPSNKGTPWGYGMANGFGQGVKNLGRKVKNIGQGLAGMPGGMMSGFSRGLRSSTNLPILTASDSSASKTILSK